MCNVYIIYYIQYKKKEWWRFQSQVKALKRISLAMYIKLVIPYLLNGCWDITDNIS